MLDGVLVGHQALSVHQRRVGTHRLLGVEHRRQQLVLDEHRLRRPSCACASVSATTTATGWPVKTTVSRASTADGRELIGFPLVARSASVSTATTPGIRRASSTSIETMRAWACGLSTGRACVRRGSSTSAAYCAAPETFSGPSMIGRGRPR